ncbi:hypothetical protein CWI39_0713p0010 [Hamiltosporidium magnivora]|uniref:Uncharacterized protein n=1 Tax=Hamiltosporidium magnivora TaxID=148818 RepID=A0A4Q9LBE6_9MICR|nr:hypothetical protein CWI39_0713p0010 [Hamiltosporidium magnivora]
MYCLKHQRIRLIFVSIILFIHLKLSLESYDIIEFRNFVNKKCSDLYQNKTKNVEKLQKYFDYAILMFYSEFYSYAAISIASYVKKSVANEFDVIIYRPCISTYGKNKVALKVFRFNKLTNKFLYISRYSNIEKSRYSFAGFIMSPNYLCKIDKSFEYFLVCFFRMYKALACFSRARDNTRDSYIRIGDVSHGKHTNIPRRFQIFQLNPHYDLFHNGFCVRMHSEIEIFEENTINKNLMIDKFNNLFGETMCIYSGSYSYYIVYNEKYETYNNKISKKSYKLNLKIHSINLRHELQILKPIYCFYMRSRVSFILKNIKIEYSYFNKYEKFSAQSRKFRIVFKHSKSIFEFNSNFLSCIVKKFIPAASTYICILRETYFDIIDLEYEANSNNFKISQIKKYNVFQTSSPVEFSPSLSAQEVLSIKDFLDMLFFNLEINF